MTGRGLNPSLQAMLEVEAGDIGRERLYKAKNVKKKS